MLSEQEIDRLIDLIVATTEVLGHDIRPGAAALMADDLSKYPFPALNKALARCRSELTGRLTPKAIIDRLEDGGVWLSANEAWARALVATDEAQTVVWTDEIAKAWQIALPILDAGDKIGARMAFIPAYDRLVQAAREAGKPVQWQISPGWDPQLRQIAVERAQTAGLLPPPKPEPVMMITGPDNKPLTEQQIQTNRERMAENFRKLGEAMKQQRIQNEIDAAHQRDAERQRFEARKAEVVAQALELEKQHNRKKEG